MARSLVEFNNVEVVRTPGGGNATLMRFPDGTEAWIPHSQFCEGCTLDQNSSLQDRGTMVIPVWLAEDRGIDCDEGDLV